MLKIITSIHPFAGGILTNDYLFNCSSAKALLEENVRKAFNNDYEFVVSIGLLRNSDTEYEHFCTGTLVSNRDVLTVEHCLIDKKMLDVRVHVGARDIRQGQKFNVIWWLSFNDWTEHQNKHLHFTQSDVSMMRLDSNVSQSIVPVILTELRNRYLFGQTVTLVRWSTREVDTNPMMKVDEVIVLDVADCEFIYQQLTGETIYFESVMFCTKTNSTVLVQSGDSGGPVIHRNTIVGINKGLFPFPNNHAHQENMNIHFGNLFSFSYAIEGEDVRPAFDDEYPYVVSVGRITNEFTEYSHVCTGALVSRRDVLTSSRCIDIARNLRHVRVLVGSTNLNQSSPYVMKWCINYDDWSNYHNVAKHFIENEVAMMRLLNNVSKTIEPGKVSNLQFRTLASYVVSIAGWSSKNDEEPNALLTADLEMIESSTCMAKIREMSGTRFYLPANVFCTRSSPESSLEDGDIGGPVIHRSEIIGINEGVCPFKDKSVASGRVNIHFEVHSYRGFIADCILKD